MYSTFSFNLINQKANKWENITKVNILMKICSLEAEAGQFANNELTKIMNTLQNLFLMFEY